MAWAFHNPVDLRFGVGAFEQLGTAIAGRSWCLVTYGEAPFAELARRAASLAGPPRLVLDDVRPNPDFVDLEQSCRRLADEGGGVELIVALGGGSVIDAAKVVAAARGDFERVRRYLVEGAKADALEPMPILALPTTAGTGSEVTPWATLWDTKARKKYSLHHERLFPVQAIVDPALMLGCPRELTVSTGLDALSHALESLWNINANPVSSALAVAAAREILAVLPELADRLDDVDLRTRMAQASTMAGLAFSNTKTALAHSLSYPITLVHGVPHGTACSFSLPMVMRLAVGHREACDESLRAIFGADLASAPARLSEFLARLNVAVEPSAYGIGEREWRDLLEQAFSGERGRNFIGALK